jgi:hypothetical protein
MCMIHLCGKWICVYRVWYVCTYSMCFAVVPGNTAKPWSPGTSVLWNMCKLSLSQLLGNIRISDLGLAVELKEGQNKTKGYAGTPGKV